MFKKEFYSGNKTLDYPLVLQQLEALIDGVNDDIANLANAASLLNLFLEDINWVGFYLYKNNILVLGPFMGLPACTKISLDKGVCGYAATTRLTARISDVHEFPGHIACDSASNSEIVIPIIKNDKLIGVLDIDSPTFDRFDELDQQYLEKFVEVLLNHSF